MSSQVLAFHQALDNAQFGQGDASEDEIITFLERLSEAERNVHEWGDRVGVLIRERVATCADVLDYTEAALAVFRVELLTAFQLRRADVDVPPVFFPKLFARQVVLTETFPFPQIRVSVPGCRLREGRPIYDQLIERVTPSTLPTAVQQPLAGVPLVGMHDGDVETIDALGAVPAVVWGALAIAALIGTGIAIDRLFFQDADVALAKLNLANNNARAAAAVTCFETRVAQEPNATAERRDAIYRSCVDASVRQFPILQRRPPEDGLFTTLLKWGSIGVAGWLGFRLARSRGWI